MNSGSAGHAKKTLVINGLMKYYYGNQQFAEGCDEDLDNCIIIYDTLSKKGEVTNAEELQSLRVLLKSDPVSFF